MPINEFENLPDETFPQLQFQCAFQLSHRSATQGVKLAVLLNLGEKKNNFFCLDGI